MKNLILSLLLVTIASPAFALTLSCRIAEGESTMDMKATAFNSARVTLQKNKKTGIEMVGENHSCLVEASGNEFDMTIINLESLPDGSQKAGENMTNTSGEILTSRANFLTVTDENGTVQCLCNAK